MRAAALASLPLVALSLGALAGCGAGSELAASAARRAFARRSPSHVPGGAARGYVAGPVRRVKGHRIAGFEI